MEPTRDDVTTWVRAALAKTGDTPSALARRAGLATTTLTRFLNEPGSPMLTLRSLAKIAHAAGMTPIGLRGASAEVAEPLQRPTIDAEAIPLDLSTVTGSVSHAIADLLAGRPSLSPWLLKSNAIDDIGYWPGDILIVDLNLTPMAGDIVCAQRFDWRRSQIETVFRLFEPPYLIAATRDRKLAEENRKPLFVDNERVIVKGVVTDLLRHRGAI